MATIACSMPASMYSRVARKREFSTLSLCSAVENGSFSAVITVRQIANTGPLKCTLQAFLTLNFCFFVEGGERPKLESEKRRHSSWTDICDLRLLKMRLKFNRAAERIRSTAVSNDHTNCKVIA